MNLALKSSNISLVKKINTLLFNSFSVRLKVVKDVVINSSEFLNFPSSSFANEDLLNLVLGLGNRFFNSTKFSFYLTKVSGQSFYFGFFKFYNQSIRSIIHLSLFPVLEVLSGKNWKGFRPYRHLNDSFFSVKNIFFRFRSRHWILRIPLVLDSSLSLFLNDFFHKRFILGYFLNNYTVNALVKARDNIFLSTFFSFLLTEFV